MPALKDKTPPHDREAEQSVLGALLIDKDAIIKVAGFLRPEHFYEDAHGQIYNAMIELFEARQPTDIVTVGSQLKKNKVMKQIGGSAYLTDVVNMVPTSANVDNYAHVVYDAFVKRRLIDVAVQIAEMGYNETATKAEELLDRAENLVFTIGQHQSFQEYESISRTLESAWDTLNELIQNPGEMRGVPTGFRALDRMLAGLQNSNLIIIAARPSVGKTSFMLNMAQYAAVQNKIPVGIFSLETSREQLAYRMLSAQAGVDGWRITTGKLEDDDLSNIMTGMGQLAESPIYIDDLAGQGVMGIRTKARRMHMEHGVKMIMVDYLQLSHSRNLENRVQEVSEISQALKNIARELNVPVVVLSQLSRAIESRGEHRPQLSDLRDSGSIEQDADVVMFLYRPDSDEKDNLKLLIAKHRNGPTGEIDLYFKSDQTRFYEVEQGR